MIFYNYLELQGLLKFPEEMLAFQMGSSIKLIGQMSKAKKS